jgi:hypothetical protein
VRFRWRDGLVGAAAAAAGAGLIVTPAAYAMHGQPYHWNREYPTVTAVAQWYIEDYSGPNWPVYGAVQKWDKRPAHYRVFWLNGGDCSHSTLHCVPTHSGNYGNTTWDGITVFQVNNDTNHIVHDSMSVRFNNYRSLTPHQHESIACHETGHTSGGFTDSSRNQSSCMYGTAAYYPLDPAKHDFDVLENNYDH